MGLKFASTKVLLYRQVTDEIIHQIDQGTRPYESAWRSADGMPWNARSKRLYTGINMLILWSAALNRAFDCHRWLTERQATALKGRLRANERGTMIFFGRRQHYCGQPSRGIYREFVVYNWLQFDGLPPLRIKPTKPTADALSRFWKLVAATGADIRYGGWEAYCLKDEGGVIQLPEPSAFYFPANDLPRTLAHELGHWCVHPSRLDLQIEGEHALMRRAYEEILVELVAAFVCRHFEIQPSVRSGDYVASWLSGTKDKYGHQPSPAETIERVAGDAMRVAGHLLSFDPGL